jgi:hypothetical protein
MNSTRFNHSQYLRQVKAEIGAGNDNWDYNSANINSRLNALVGTLLGPDHYNLTAPIKIKFTGLGKPSIVERRT